MPTNHSVIPAGWYRIAWSGELVVGALKRMKYFGQELVCYRGESGRIHMFDAYCQHLGAHMGVGGRVEGDELVCPFHGWKWACDGKSAKVPYEEGRTSYRKLRKWATHEDGGIVFAWYAADGSEPSWTVPAMPSSTPGGDAFYPIFPFAVTTWDNTRVHPQNMTENLADPAHIKYVHKAKNIAATVEAGAESHKFSAVVAYVFGEGRVSTWLTPDGPVDLLVKSTGYGLGFQITHYEGLHDAVQISGATPIDFEHSQLWNTLFIPKTPDAKSDKPDDRWLRLFKQVSGQIDEDLPIWENMIHIEHPPFPKLEAKNYRAIRAWAGQFYLGDKSGRQQVA